MSPRLAFDLCAPLPTFTQIDENENLTKKKLKQIHIICDILTIEQKMYWK